MDMMADSPGFMLLGCGSSIKGLQMGRKLLTQWGFRRSEEIVWVHQASLSESKPAQRLGTACQLQNQLFVQSKEHFLLGIKGTVRRSLDSHAIHTNLDTDVIVTTDSQLAGVDKKGGTKYIPHELFSILERLCLGRRRVYFQFAD